MSTGSASMICNDVTRSARERHPNSVPVDAQRSIAHHCKVRRKVKNDFSKTETKRTKSQGRQKLYDLSSTRIDKMIVLVATRTQSGCHRKKSAPLRGELRRRDRITTGTAGAGSTSTLSWRKQLRERAITRNAPQIKE